jgi:hypothetical protein
MDWGRTERDRERERDRVRTIYTGQTPSCDIRRFSLPSTLPTLSSVSRSRIYILSLPLLRYRVSVNDSSSISLKRTVKDKILIGGWFRLEVGNWKQRRNGMSPNPSCPFFAPLGKYALFQLPLSRSFTSGAIKTQAMDV